MRFNVKDGLRAAGFFLLRTPLLALDVLTAWSGGLVAPSAREGELETAVATDREVLRARLRALVEQPAIADALASASRSLTDGIAEWLASPDSEAGERLERALVRYVCRMAARPTPFQLLAGVSVGTVAARTVLELASSQTYRRHARPESARVHELASTLARDPSLMASLRYRPSSALYVLHDELRGFRRSERDGVRTWSAVRVRRTPVRDALLARATHGATASELQRAALACDAQLEASVAAQAVDELISSGLLVHDLEPPLTGGDPHAWLAGRVAPAHAEEVEQARAAPPDALQIDLVKPVVEATLSARVASEIAGALDALARLAPRAPDPLARLREAYARRFDDLETPRFVPLAELVDPDCGVGLDGPQGPYAGWIAQLAIAPAAAEPTWGPRERMLLAKLTDALATRATEIQLAPEDLEAFAAPPLPDSLSVIASVVAHGDDFRVVVHHGRAHATRLLGRFSHLDEVRPAIDQLVALESARYPDAVLAEVVHLPAGPMDLLGALHQRPVLREYEIPLLACSGAPAEHQLPLDDLLVAVGRDRVVLWSRRLGKRVVPKLSSAHRVEYRKGHVPAYRLMFAIENEGSPPYLEWTWAPIAAPFLPRVTVGRAVLALAEWQLGPADVAGLDAPTPARRLAAVRALRERLAIPRVVSSIDVDRPTFDNALYVDLEHSLAVDAFVHAAKTAGRAVLRETFATPDELVVRSPDGRFTNEIVVPFVRGGVRSEDVPAATESRGPRAFPPGADWMTLRVDAGMGRFDRVLLDHLLPVVRRAQVSGDVDGWFFLRLGLPTPQLRLRVHCAPARASGPRGELEAIIGELVARGEVFRAEWTTYEREVERYGGDEGVAIAERIFEADSDAVAATIAALSDPADELARERLALVGVDRLLGDLGLSLADKLSTLEAICTRWRAEQGVDKALDIRLGDAFRAERTTLQRMLAGDGPELVAFVPVWQRRSVRVGPNGAALHALHHQGRLTLEVPKLAASLAHMHCIRLMSRHSRVHELVIYDFLRRLYRSQTARDGTH